MRVWRLTRACHAASAFSGEGARRGSARWNPVGVPMVYTSSSLSLTLVEVFVHLDAPEAPDDMVVIEATLPQVEGTIERLDEAKLPKDWRRLESSRLQEIGAEWVRSGRTLALEVPSAVVEGERNILINPAHPVAANIRLSPPKPFRFDERMFRRLGRVE